MVVQKLHDPWKQVAIAQTKALVPPLSMKGVACKTTKAPGLKFIPLHKYMPPEFIKENPVYGYISFLILTSNLFCSCSVKQPIECISIMIKLHFSKAQFKCRAGEVLSSKLVEKGTLYTLLPARQAGTLTNHDCID